MEGRNFGFVKGGDGGGWIGGEWGFAMLYIWGFLGGVLGDWDWVNVLMVPGDPGKAAFSVLGDKDFF